MVMIMKMMWNKIVDCRPPALPPVKNTHNNYIWVLVVFDFII